MEMMFIAVIGGLIGGFMNTVASSGSAITLPILLLMGLPPAVANATNRIPVFLGLLVSSITFIRAGLINWQLLLKTALPCTLGSILGALIADRVPEYVVKGLILFAVVMALLLLLTNFKKAFARAIDELPRYRWQEAIYLFLVGLWIGLIVLDGGTYLLMVLMLSMQMPLLKANAYKNVICLITSGISLVVMGIDGNVNWELGGVMALGSIVGGYIGAKFSMHPVAKTWTYRLLVAIISLELVHMAFTEFYPSHLFSS